MVRYGLRHIESGNLCGFITTANCEGDFCNEISHELTWITGDEIWLVSERSEAEYARTHNTEWFNAGYMTPENPYNPDELEVVEIELSIRRV
jgi:hypothetical protein